MRMRWIAPLLLTAWWVLAGGCTTGGIRGKAAATDARCRITDGSAPDRFNIRAQDAPFTVVLSELRAKRGIEVRPNAVVDSRVDVDLKDVTIDEALAQIVPADVHYAVRLGERDVARPAGKGEKKGSSTRPAGLPTKSTGEHRPPPIDPARPSKRPTDAPPRAPQFGGQFKPDPKQVAEVPPGKGPKRERAAPATQPETHSLQLRLLIDQQGVKLQSAVLLEGAPTQQKTMRDGTLLAVVSAADGAIVAMDAVPDPLEEHSYRPDGTHETFRAPEATFNVRLPGSVADAERLGRLKLQFFDAREMKLPADLDLKALGPMLQQSKPLGSIEGAAITPALNAK